MSTTDWTSVLDDVMHDLPWAGSRDKRSREKRAFVAFRQLMERGATYGEAITARRERAERDQEPAIADTLKAALDYLAVDDDRAHEAILDALVAAFGTMGYA